MKKIFYIIFLTLITSCNTKNHESDFLDFFIKSYWNAEVYSNECAGHEFHENWEFIVSNRTHSIDFKLNIAPIVKNDCTILIDKKLDEKISLTNSRIPSRKLNNNQYFVRLTPRYKNGNQVYQGIWIKGDYYSSGYYYLFKVLGKYDYKIEIVVRTCDNWG